MRDEVALSFDFFQQAQSLASELQLTGIECACFAGLAKAHAHQGALEQAYACLDQAEKLMGDGEGLFVPLVVLLSRIEVDIEAQAWGHVEQNLKKADALGRTIANDRSPVHQELSRLRVRFEERSR